MLAHNATTLHVGVELPRVLVDSEDLGPAGAFEQKVTVLNAPAGPQRYKFLPERVRNVGESA